MPDFIHPDWPAPTGVKSLQTTRRGGVSLPPWESFNLGGHVGDDPVAVAENRARLAAFLPAPPCWLEQVHGVRVMNLDHGHDGQPADASVSRVPGHVCVVMTADCLPVLFCDRDASVVAAAHAGWRGLLAGVLENTLAAMRVAPARVLAWLGPAIGFDAFEVGEEVKVAFLAQDSGAASCFRNVAPGKYHADLYALARRRLLARGVTAVFGGDFCVHTDKARFFSYRREGRTGRMASLIWIAGDRSSGISA
jgi:YfiH family protein